MASLLINALSGTGVMRVAKELEEQFLALLALPLLIKASYGKLFTRARRKRNNMDHIRTKITFCSIF